MTARVSLPPPTAPFVLDRFPVPSQQRVGGNRKRPPPSSRKQSAGCSEDRSICSPIPIACMRLPFEDTHPAPGHHDLDALLRLGPMGRHHEAKSATRGDVEEEESHTGRCPRVDGKSQSRGPIGVSVPLSHLAPTSRHVLT